ncbi:MAG: GDCCVxC domain-containing (seleno)protein [bacterium]|nr:GDCCVxC domain-containing (seleno)protein [bacterium]
MKTQLPDSLEKYRSEITCPHCGYKKFEMMPTDVCVIRYICENCKSTLHPKDGDCCVFCTYGSKVCPSMQ